MTKPDHHAVLDAHGSGAAAPPIPLGAAATALHEVACMARPIRNFPLAPAYAKIPVRAVNFSLDRGREQRAPSPPSEPGVRFSRDGLSSQLFPHRDWRAA